MKTNNKKIGNAYERKIAKMLSLVLSNGTRTDLFCRTPGSGNTYKSGDLMLVDNTPDYQWINDYVIEVKTVKTGSIVPPKNLLKLIEQCEDRYDKPWVLIIKFRTHTKDVYFITAVKINDYVAKIATKTKTYYVNTLKNIFELRTANV